LKVLVVSSKYQPEYSGSGLRAHRTYLRLREKFDIDFEVISSSTESNVREQYTLDDVKIERVVSKRLRNLNRWLTGTPLRRITNALMSHLESRAVKKVIASKTFDLIHTFGYSPATAAAIKWSRKHNTPLILELVNPMPTPYQYLPGLRYFSNQDLATQSAIVAISKELGDMCRSHGLTENVWTRPNPVDTDLFTIASESRKFEAREKISSASNDEKLIVYVAKYSTRKNHTFLLDVLAELPANYRLVLAGPPLTDRDLIPGLRADQIPSLNKRAEQLGVENRVEISHGFVDMPEYLAAADVFCFPSKNEGMGTPLLESLAAGVPVVANAGESAFREHILDGENGYLRELDPAAWAEAIVKASDITDSARQKFAADISDKYSTDRIDSSYQKLMTALVSSNQGEQLSVAEVLDP
jgi:glycosyltransferase involved in cell wall biosynthesis